MLFGPFRNQFMCFGFGNMFFGGTEVRSVLCKGRLVSLSGGHKWGSFKNGLISHLAMFNLFYTISGIMAFISPAAEAWTERYNKIAREISRGGNVRIRSSTISITNSIEIALQITTFLFFFCQKKKSSVCFSHQHSRAKEKPQTTKHPT